MDKVKLRQAVVVEGKYDQNTLRQLVDTAVFTTNGFTDMKDPALLRLLRHAAVLEKQRPFAHKRAIWQALFPLKSAIYKFLTGRSRVSRKRPPA